MASMQLRPINSTRDTDDGCDNYLDIESKTENLKTAFIVNDFVSVKIVWFQMEK